MALPLLVGLGSVISSIVGILSAIYNNPVVRITVWKALFIFLFMVVLPVAMTKFLTTLMAWVIAKSNAEMGSGLSLQSLSFTGFAAYLMDKCKVIQSFNVIMSACVASFIISCIPGRGR